MIWTVFQISVRRLIHNRVELLLTFVVPIAFFSIFAIIFGGGIGSGTTPKIKVVAVDEVHSAASRSLINELRQSAGLRFMRDQPVEQTTAREMVRRGNLTMAIVLRPSSPQPEGAEELWLDDDSAGSISAGSISADLLSDASDQVASQVVTAVVARAIMMARAAEQEQQFSVFGVKRVSDDSSQPVTVVQASAELNAANEQVNSADERSLESSGMPLGNVETQREESPVRVVDVIGEGKSNPVISMYAAGIAVMFLLFGATGGGGSLLEERENQTLDRLLSTQLSMDQLLLGKWFYMTCLGVIQVSVMFVWAQLVFGVDLLGHLDGFLMMTLVTAGTASAFGLLLATLCKSRGQLNGLSVILILTMSALGGSMVPRYVMSERLQQVGLWTFNAWALDGYNKVFWRELSVASLAPQLMVLMLSGLGFLVIARGLALRWESN